MVIALVGCKPIEPAFYQRATTVNYAEIAGPNFFITESDAVGFDYAGIASLYVVESTGATKVEKKKDKYAKDDIYGEDSNKFYYVTSGVRNADIRSALAFAVEKAKELGGNGIIKLRTNVEWDAIKNRPDHVEVTGMVIRRRN